MENIITTFDGTRANKKDCRFIKGEFYIKNKQCFFIGDTWYRINSGYIAKDHETREYVLIKDSNITKGIIDYNKENDTVVIGYFTPNNHRNVNVILPDGTRMKAFDEYILKDAFILDIYHLEFVHKSTTIPSNSKKINEGWSLSNNPYGELKYNLRNHSKEELDEFSSIALKRILSHIPAEGLTKDTSSLPKYTYGLEFETYAGVIPFWELKNGGFIPLRDGSIRGVEFVTLPYNSDVIGNAVSLACKTLNTFVKMTSNESLHLHIGNIRVCDEKFIGILYTLCCLLEDEIFSMFPAYYSETSKFKVRGKDYNKPLAKALVSHNPTETFENISVYLSGGKKYGGFGSNHPSDPDGSHKWQIETRYHWVNFINLLFGNNKTIEFRVHVPSKNPYKIINWIFITSAIVKYAEYIRSTNVSLESLLGITLDKVINHTYSMSVSKKLNDYVHYRKNLRKTADLSGDFTGESEISNDMKYFD